MHVTRISEHSFLSRPITPGCTIVDLGTNLGGFSHSMVTTFGCRVVGVEPHPALFARARQTPGLNVEHLAVTKDGAPVTLYLNDHILGATTQRELADPEVETVEVGGVTLAEILQRHGLDRVPLVKVDIEGAELAMFEAAPLEVLRRVDQFTVEFHDFLDPTQTDAIVQVNRRLQSAGFTRMAFSTDNTDVLFVNQAHVRFGPIEQAVAGLLYKYARGVRRNIRHRLAARANRAPRE